MPINWNIHNKSLHVNEVAAQSKEISIYGKVTIETRQAGVKGEELTIMMGQEHHSWPVSDECVENRMFTVDVALNGLYIML